MTYDYARLAKIKCFLFDMDGTINLGNELIPGMEGFFDKLKAAGKEYYLLTNNSSRSHEHYVQKMNGLGVPVTRENILISSDALTNWMQKNKPGAKLFVLGTPQLLAYNEIIMLSSSRPVSDATALQSNMPSLSRSVWLLASPWITDASGSMSES